MLTIKKYSTAYPTVTLPWLQSSSEEITTSTKKIKPPPSNLYFTLLTYFLAIPVADDKMVIVLGSVLFNLFSYENGQNFFKLSGDELKVYLFLWWHFKQYQFNELPSNDDLLEQFLTEMKSKLVFVLLFLI